MNHPPACADPASGGDGGSGGLLGAWVAGTGAHSASLGLQGRRPAVVVRRSMPHGARSDIKRDTCPRKTRAHQEPRWGTRSLVIRRWTT
jgi:hypothetical protein